MEVKERPILIIFNGDMTHLDVETAKCSKRNKITVIKLPAHTTDVLQPLDTSNCYLFCRA